MDKRNRMWDLEELSQFHIQRPIEAIDDGPFIVSAPSADAHDNITEWDDSDPEDQIAPGPRSADADVAPDDPSSITLIHGGGIITRYADQAGIEIGRGQSQLTPSSIRVEHHLVSRSHCKIEFVQGAFHVIDRSTNGTTIQGDSGATVRVHRQRLALTDLSGWIVLGRTIHSPRIRYHVLLSLTDDGFA